MRETDEFWDNGDDSNGEPGKCFQQQVVFIQEAYHNSQSSKPKTRRRRWTQKDMTNAFNAVKCTGMSLRGAASHYNVPESTLRDRVHGRVSLDCSRPGPPTFFTYEEEKKMVDHILFMSKIGYPYTRNQVVELAGDMTKAVDRIAPFKFLNPSQAWFYAFLNRWPDLKNYLYGPRSNRKSKGVSAESIQAYYDNLEKVLSKYDIKNKPEHIWMTDEVSIACDNSNVPKILPITIQRPQSNTYWNPTAAVLGAGNAAGDKIPAFLMFKASEISNEMMEGTVKGSKFATSNNGWVNADAFIQWYERHFRPLIPQRPVILLYDGHLQFVTVRVLEKAKEDNVLLFPLPPHPPYNHCVESSCFAAYPKYFNKRIQKFHDDFKRNINKTNVSRIICQAYEWALQPINLISIFFKLGICPYNNLSNNLAPYMPDNYDDYQNDENMENIESDYSHYDSPVDRNFTPDDSYGVPPPIYHNNMSANNTPTTASGTNSPAKFYPQSSSVYSASNNSHVKVLDNMASKAMNQIHAQRSELSNNHTKLIPLAASNIDQNHISTFVPFKNSSGQHRSSVMVRPGIGQNQSSICKLSPVTSYHQLSSNMSSNNPHLRLVSPTDADKTLTATGSTPIKVIKSSLAGNSGGSVIIQSSSSTGATAKIQVSSSSRPLIRVHSINPDSQEPPIKKPAILITKSDSYIRCMVSDPIIPSGTAAAAAVSNVKDQLPPVVVGATSPKISTAAAPSGANAPTITTPLVYDQRDLELHDSRQDDEEDVIDEDDEEMSQTCNVCGQVEPPGLSQLSDEELVVDWAHCDFCYKWVHLQPCCDSRCVQPDNRFKCIVCISGIGVAGASVIKDCSNTEEAMDVDHQYLLHQSSLPPLATVNLAPSSDDADIPAFGTASTILQHENS